MRTDFPRALHEVRSEARFPLSVVAVMLMGGASAGADYGSAKEAARNRFVVRHSFFGLIQGT